MSTIVENTNPVAVDIEPKYSVTTQSGAIVENEAPEYNVSVQRKEYKVVGDNIYIPRLYDDAPQWMKDLVNTVVDVKTAVAVGNLDDALEALRTLSDELEVAKNTYANSIISSNDIDQRINTAIETLNSALSDADATIMNIAQTATTPAEASAIALNTLSASLSASGEIGSFISNMNSAFADLDSTTTQSINFMESAINAEFSANATALNTIRTYVGIDDAGASTGTGLSAYLEDSTGTIGGADSQLANDVRVTAEGVESKFAYNSIVNINGIYKKSGFGLTTNYTSGTGTQANPYVSEFWIDATKLRFTNSNVTGRTAPFTIDATGANPVITFNGKVSFTNVTGYIAPDVSGEISTNNDTFAQKLGYANYAAMVSAASSGQTIINGGYIRTGLIQADEIIAGGILANAVIGNTISGSTITGSKIYGAQIEGSIIKASYIDLTSTVTLTNWQQYTPVNYPSQYASNFAHNNDGSLVVDSLGYVRLIGNTNIILSGSVYNNNYVQNSNYTPAVSIPPYELNLHGHDDYKYNSTNRIINSNHTLSTSTAQKFTIASLAGIAKTSSSCTCILKFYVFEDYYDMYMYGSQDSKSNWNGISGYIKKNGVVVASTSSIYVAMTYTMDILGIPFTLSGNTGTYGGVSLVAVSTNNISTATAISCSGKYGSMLKVIEGTCSSRMSISVNIPVITVA